MSDAIFLSASVPDPRRAPEYAESADTVAISAAITALVHVTLGRRLLVWGGHPAVTPMVWAVAEGLGVDYGGWVKLYQSRFFKDEFPEDNDHFNNVTYTERSGEDREQSLLFMRTRMFRETTFSAAVFIGGMGGIVDEFNLLREIQPKVAMLPVASSGGAVLEVARRLENYPPELNSDLDYVSMFHRLLGVPVGERRYRNPADQPESPAERLWTPEDGPIGIR
jgi:hypothetical protein